MMIYNCFKACHISISYIGLHCNYFSICFCAVPDTSLAMFLILQNLRDAA